MVQTRALYQTIDGDWRWSDPANCNNHERCYIKRDGDYNFFYGEGRQHKLFKRDMVAYCEECKHLCYDTQSSRDNDSPSNIGQWAVDNGFEGSLEPALECMRLEEQVMVALTDLPEKRKSKKRKSKK